MTTPSGLDHSRVPVLEALEKFHRRGDWVFAPPGHRQGYGVDPRVLAMMGHGAFTSDVLIMNGLDDRRTSQGILEQAQELMADAAGPRGQPRRQGDAADHPHRLGHLR